MADYDAVLQEVDTRVNALIAKGLSEVDALSKVFAADRQLYEQYAKAAATPPARTAQAPRLSGEPVGVEAEVLKRAEALVRQSAGLSMADAISDTFRDDADLYRRYTMSHTEASDVDKVEEQAPPPQMIIKTHPLAPDLLEIAKLFSPSDPTGFGMLRTKQALGLLRETLEKKKCARMSA